MATEHSTTHSAEEDARNRDILIWVNGALKPRDQAVVSVYDSGFMLGDGMWEGMRLYNGKWAFFDEHMDRLFDSCRAVSLDIGMDRAGVLAALTETAQANGMTHDVHCRLMVTRGVKVRPFQHPKLSQSGPTVVIIMEHSKPVDTLQSAGIRLATVPQVRGLPTSQDAKYNSHSKLNCVIACLQAEQAGADEALMLDPRGFVASCNSTNFFIIRGRELWTSTGSYSFKGLTQRAVIESWQAQGGIALEKDFTLAETYSADEAFVTGTLGGVSPVVRIDGRTIGSGRPGPITADVAETYQQWVSR